jgi:hypothetical protein
MLDAHIPQIDRVFASPGRFGVVSQLIESGGKATFNALVAHPFIDGDSGSLNRHNARLKREGYVTIEKRFVDNKPETTIALTDQGRQAFEKHCRALGKVIKAITEEVA